MPPERQTVFGAVESCHGEPVRVLHVIKGLGPGGAERLLVSLAASRSSDVDFDVAYLLPHKDHLVSELRAAGARVHLIGGSRGIADPSWLLRLRRVARRRRPDVVHLHSPAVAAGAIPLLRALRRRPVIVTTEHNLWPSFGGITRRANALVLPLADARLAVSEEVRSSMVGRHRDRTRVVVQGIPVAALSARRVERAAARAALGLRDEDVLVATVANFREKKDYPTLLEAAAACAGSAGLRFVSIGQGPLEDEMHALHRRLGLGDRFRFLGYQADVPATVVAADVFALTSRHEGLPIALLEAMALGVPPVVTSVGGIPEVVTDGIDGIVLPPGDPIRFATAFQQLAGDSHRRAEIGAAAATRAEDFDIARTQLELEAIYRQLLGDR